MSPGPGAPLALFTPEIAGVRASSCSAIGKAAPLDAIRRSVAGPTPKLEGTRKLICVALEKTGWTGTSLREICAPVRFCPKIVANWPAWKDDCDESLALITLEMA